MDDELELNIAAPTARAAPRKPQNIVRKDGGAKRPADNTAAKQAVRPGGQSKAANIKPKGFNQQGGKQVDRPQNGHRGGIEKRPRPDQQAGRGPKLAKPEGRRGREKQTAGKERFKRSAGGRADDPDDPDELLTAGGPDGEEEDDVAAAMASMASREASLRAEAEAAAAAGGGTARAPAAELEGVVDFGDDDDDGGARKRRRLNAGTTGGGGGGGGGAVKASGRGNFTPGSLTRAAANANAADADGDGSGGAAAAGGAAGGGGWTQLGLAASLAAQLESLGFTAPTPIQRAVLPVLVRGERDALVRAQTGSGKTLCYLLPIIHDLQAQQPRISRAEGTYAIILAPTRELCIQVLDVASALLKRYHWLVPGLLIGGEHRGHEKARLRKGVTLLAATPGRLLDHLASTAAFKTTELRWLVLDEADRLLDLGFEAKLREITALLNRRAAGGHDGAGGKGPKQAAAAAAAEEDEEGNQGGDGMEEEEGQDGPTSGRRRGGGGGSKGRGQRGAGDGGGGGGGDGGGAEGGRRRTVLLSATLHQQLGALAELAMRDPACVGFEMKQTASGPRLTATPATTAAGGTTDASADGDGADAGADGGLSTYSLPASLRQSWIEVPAKERLVSLAALLRRCTARRRLGGTKVVVFLSSCDGVEFHHHLLRDVWPLAAGGPLLQRGVALLKLHGDMPQRERTETFAGFAKEGDGVLLCTDVAARGLDFPNVSTIIQYDIPGALAEYVHRVGRSARMGAAGEAVLVLMPHEVPYVSLLRSRGVLLEQEPLDRLARWMPAPPPEAAAAALPKAARRAAAAGGGGGGAEGAAAASRQLAQHFHRLLLGCVDRDPHAAKLASDAFRSYVRAYASHSGQQKAAFGVRHLHLGHVAHAFCLGAPPSVVGSSASAADRKRKKAAAAEAAQKDKWRKMKSAARRAAA